MPVNEEVRHSRNLQMMGQLSEAVAHDMNNLLSGVLGYSELLMEEPVPEPMKPFVDEIMKAGRRLASLTRLLLIFREREYRPETLDINRVILDLEKFIKKLLGSGIQLTTSLQPAIWPVKMDSAQIRKVLLTIAFEMRDSIPEGGQMTYSTELLFVPDISGDALDLPPGRYVRIVAGSSVHIPLSTLESFTKAVAGREEEPALNNMSLSEIVEICGGRLFCFSPSGQPSAIHVCLPAPESKNAVEDTE